MAYTTIDNPELYFQVKIYTGNGADDHAITFDGSEDMQPDLLWFKGRAAPSSGSSAHRLIDSVRGITNLLASNSSDAEFQETGDGISSIDSDGFTLQINSQNDYNTSSKTYVAWCWKESATAGFDINLHTGNGSARTISHSLSAKPDFFVVKGRTFAEQWECYHKSLGATKCLQWDDNSAEADLLNRFNDTEPTSSVFTVGDADAVNKNTYTYVTYLWSGKQGFSKFGKYTGNGNADGTFVYTGFRPAWVMVKITSGTDNWNIVDNKRATYNEAENTMRANLTNAEYTGTAYGIDILSNGFKCRTDDGNFNGSSTYVYMAFAEAPFVNSKGVPANAR